MSTLINYEHIGIEGFKKQGERQFFVRVKIPAGVLSSLQAQKIADVSEKFGTGSIHLTVRGNMEIHRLEERYVGDVFRQLKSVGLELRGATGGAVRSVSCSSVLSEGFNQSQTLARKIQHHFTSNPHFEGVPKKFKIGVEGCYQDACHLIQDVCLVYSGESEGEKTYDVWIGGGLGKQPMEAFLYRQHLPEKRILALIESVLEIYMAEAEAGVRLKTLIKNKGRERFIQELDCKLESRRDLPLRSGFEQRLTSLSAQPGRGKLVVPVPFGQISGADLRRLAEFASRFSGDYLVLTSSQNLVLFVSSLAMEMEAMGELEENGFLAEEKIQGINFRTCPGSHECPRGLIATREIGPVVLAHLSESGRGLKVALSGCPNSCVRPQTADWGILARSKKPSFDVFRRQGENLGRVVHKDISLDELLNVVRKID